MDRLVRKKELLATTGFSYATIWRLENAGLFPKRRKISDNAVAWLESEVNEWLQSRQPIHTCRPVAVPAPGKKRGRPAKQKAA